MRIMWMSNAPWAGTGYGVQTKLLLPRLQALGHEVECFAFYGLHGGRITYDGYNVWPCSDFDAWGNDVIRLHLKHSKVDAVVTLLDPFVLDVDIWGKLEVPWIAWVPVDCDNIGWETLARLKLVNYNVAMSNHGAMQMELHGIPAAETIYHAVDPAQYYEEDQTESRKALGLDPDCFLIGMVMANKGDRKQFAKHFEAIRMFMDRRPELNVQVLMHTDQTPKMGGWDIPQLARKFGINGHLSTTSQYFTTVVYADVSELRKMYSSMDVLMQCSAGEGFGVPIVEAQVCGTPVITHSVTSMPEITSNGYGVDPSEKYLAMHGGFQYLPDVSQMADRLDDIYLRDVHPHKELGQQFVNSACHVDLIAAQWDQLLREVEAREAAHAATDPAAPVPSDQGQERNGAELALD